MSAQRIAELWSWARDDAGPDTGDVALVEIRASSGAWTFGNFLTPAEPMPSDAIVDPDDLARVNAEPGRQRAVVPTGALGGDDAAILAIMRFLLELARVHHSARASYGLAHAIIAAQSATYSGRGAGAGVVWNAVPMMRSANAAAARLVTRTLGGQYGRLHDPRFGILFRVEREPLALEDLPRHLSVFAALWPGAFERATQQVGGPATVLAAAHPAAPAWWDVLRADSRFTALSKAAEVFTPSAEEIAAFALPSDAWRPLEAVVDRGQSYGLALIKHL